MRLVRGIDDARPRERIGLSLGGYGAAALLLTPGGPLGAFALHATAGFGGAGKDGKWGGFGPIVTVSPAYRLVHRDRLHIGLQGQFVYGQLFFPDGRAFRPWIGITVGPEWTWH